MDTKPLVSIDVFDTAVLRKVFKPTDIFNLVEENVGNNFKVARLLAQEKARKKNIYYDISDIYRLLPFTLSPKAEIKEEILNSEANPYILDLYNKQEADYIFISDMYLPSAVIVQMLEKCGYKNPNVFVSCEFKALKGNGLLFTKVENFLKRKIQKHIGDNYSADILGAKKAGIPEVEFIGPNIYTKEVLTPELENVKLRKLLINEELSNASIEEKIGYIFAPLVLSFVQTVLDEASDEETIFFNARDSFILYVVARWILKTDKKIKYCRFSRKSCHLPNINTSYKINSEVNKKAMGFFRTLRINNIGEFLNTFGFKGDYSKLLSLLGVNKETQLDYTSQKNQILEKFITAIQDDLYEKARASRKNFRSYINKLGMKDGDIFVDLGHFGSMQSIIKSITGIRLKGRYIHRYGTTSYFEGVSEDKTSFLPVGHIKFHTGVVELIFSEPIGTSVAYSEDGNVILNKDTKYRKEITKALLRGVIKGVRDILENNIENIPYNDIIVVMDRLLKHPTIEEAEFGNSKIFENGSYDNNESIVWFDESYIKRGKIRECFNRSYWKEAFKLLLKNSKYKFLEKELGV